MERYRDRLLLLIQGRSSLFSTDNEALPPANCHRLLSLALAMRRRIMVCSKEEADADLLSEKTSETEEIIDMDISPVPFVGKRATLIPLEEGHIDALYEAGRFPEIWSWWPVRISTREEMKQLVLTFLQDQ